MENNKKAKREAYLPLIGCYVTGALLLYGGVGLYYGWIEDSFWDNLLLLITIVLLFVVSIYTIVVTIKYILIVSKKQDMPTWKKALWIICLFEFNIYTIPIFWRVHIDKTDPELALEEKRQRKEVARRNREFDKKRRAEIREKKAHEKQEEQLIRKEQTNNYLRNSRIPFPVTVMPISFFAGGIFSHAYSLSFALGLPDDIYEIPSAIMTCLFILLVVSSIILIVLFGSHVRINERLSKGKKIVWIVLLMVFNMLVFPIYWDMYIGDKNSIFYRKKAKSELAWSMVPGVLIAIFIIWGIFDPNYAMNTDMGFLLIELLLVSMPLSYIFVMLKYILLACENEQLSIRAKIFWSIGFVLLGIVTCPVYWIRYNHKQLKVREEE